MGKVVGWDMEKVYVFPTISTAGEGRTQMRGSLPLSASQMTVKVLLRQGAAAAGVQGDLSMRSFCV